MGRCVRRRDDDAVDKNGVVESSSCLTLEVVAVVVDFGRGDGRGIGVEVVCVAV